MAKRPSHHVGWHSTTAGGVAERGLVQIACGVPAVTLTCTSHVEIIRLKLDQGAVQGGAWRGSRTTAMVARPIFRRRRACDRIDPAYARTMDLGRGIGRSARIEIDSMRTLWRELVRLRYEQRQAAMSRSNRC